MVVKICGIREYEDALLCAREGADLIGFVFAESPRRIEPEKARDIILRVREESKKKPLFVGVFANQDMEEVMEGVEISGVDMVQLAGDETPSFISPIPKPKIKSLSPDTDISLIEEYIKSGAIILLDSRKGDRYGGTGEVVDWDRARYVAERFPIILAGGLSPENVREAVRRVRPWGVDVSSGVEIAPGKKDRGKIRAFIREARDEVR